MYLALLGTVYALWSIAALFAHLYISEDTKIQMKNCGHPFFTKRLRLILLNIGTRFVPSNASNVLSDTEC